MKEFNPTDSALKILDIPLWAIGDLGILNMPLVSVVGSRDISPYGVLLAKKCTRILLDHGIGVVSGLAMGVDSVAHSFALDHGGKTIAVLGTPIDQCYPKENRQLMDRIMDQGLLLSQFPPGSVVSKGNFPQRNLTMAKLSGITIVVEASEKSGTRHQVLHALKIGKRVGFPKWLIQKKIPWITHSLQQEGCFMISEQSDLERELVEVFA